MSENTASEWVEQSARDGSPHWAEGSTKRSIADWAEAFERERSGFE